MTELFAPATATRAEIEAVQSCLSPCPHCGWRGAIELMPNTTAQWRVRCCNAWCFTTTSPRPSVTEAARVWNRRPDSSRPSAFWAPHSTLDPNATV